MTALSSSVAIVCPEVVFNPPLLLIFVQVFPLFDDANSPVEARTNTLPDDGEIAICWIGI